MQHLKIKMQQRELSKEVDVMIVIGGKNSSNTKQLHSICLENCLDSYLIENETELENSWFLNKKIMRSNSWCFNTRLDNTTGCR